MQFHLSNPPYPGQKILSYITKLMGFNIDNIKAKWKWKYITVVIWEYPFVHSPNKSFFGKDLSSLANILKKKINNYVEQCENHPGFSEFCVWVGGAGAGVLLFSKIVSWVISSNRHWLLNSMLYQTTAAKE